jgi:hypothetical protein
MTLRSQTAAIVILLAALGIVFVLVASGGVSSEVFLAENTSTPSPTIESTATPIPEGFAGNWVEDPVVPGQWTYTGDPNVNVVITENVVPLADLATQFGVEIPEDAPLAPLTILEAFRTSTAEQFASVGTEAMTFEGPSVRLYGGTPVTLIRVFGAAQILQQYPEGLDQTIALVDQGDGNANLIIYSYPGPRNDDIFREFETWLTGKASDLAQPEATAEATETVEGTEEAAATEAPEGTEEAEATAEAPAGTEEAEATAEVAATEAPVTEATEAATPEAEATEGEPQTWTETGEGQFLYTADPEILAQITYQIAPLEVILQRSNLEAPAEDSETPLIDLLNQFKTLLPLQFAQMGLTVEEDAIDGPSTETIAGVEMALLKVQIAPVESPQEGVPAFPGAEVVLVMIDVGEGQINTIQYVLQGEPNDAVYEAFVQWMEENIAVLTTPVAVPEETATEAAAPPATEAAE